MYNPTDRARIGLTDLKVTRLGLGTAPIGNLLWEVPEEDAQGAFKAAFEAGVRYVDTAAFYGYGLAENRVGRALTGQNRDDFDCFLLAGRYSLLDQTALPEFLPKCVERGVSIVLGGVFNSGLLADPKPGITFNYVEAPQELIDQVVEWQYSG